MERKVGDDLCGHETKRHRGNAGAVNTCRRFYEWKGTRPLQNVYPESSPTLAAPGMYLGQAHKCRANERDPQRWAAAALPAKGGASVSLAESKGPRTRKHASLPGDRGRGKCPCRAGCFGAGCLLIATGPFISFSMVSLPLRAPSVEQSPAPRIAPPAGAFLLSPSSYRSDPSQRLQLTVAAPLGLAVCPRAALRRRYLRCRRVVEYAAVHYLAKVQSEEAG